MADRCEYCLVRMDGLEVHADGCPVRGPEIAAESEGLKAENIRLRSEVATLEAAAEGGLRITCDNAYHDRGHGICSFCVQDRIKKALEPYQNALGKIHDLAGQIMGPDSHPNLGAIQDWVHQVLPCEVKQDVPAPQYCPPPLEPCLCGTPHVKTKLLANSNGHSANCGCQQCF